MNSIHKRQEKLTRSLCGALFSGALLLSTPALHAQVLTWDVNLPPGISTLYSDPYNGNVILRGGFSGLYPIPGEPDRFYVVSDRGPAPDFTDAANVLRKVWVIPEFGPHIYTVRLKQNGIAKIESVTPFTRPDGGTVTGLPTTLPATDIPYDVNLNVLPFDEDSLDVEGITIDPWGNFWVCDEYKPSVAMVNASGQVQLRLVPAGTKTGTELVPTFDMLPGVLAKRRNNRGFEGVTASSTGVLYACVQRPLNNPNRAAADANGNARLVAIDLNVVIHGAPGTAVKQYLYQMPPANGSVTVSDLFSTGPTKMLIPERNTDKLFEIDVAGATDITLLENAAGKLISNPAKTFEQLTPAEMSLLGVVGVSKTVVIPSLLAISPLLEKVEGVCVRDGRIYLTYDNDFNVGEAGSIPAAPDPLGPFMQLELLPGLYPKVFSVPAP